MKVFCENQCQKLFNCFMFIVVFKPGSLLHQTTTLGQLPDKLPTE